MRNRIHRGVVLVWGSSWLLGCSGGYDDPPLVLRFESEHYDYYSGEEVCSGLPEALEAEHDVLVSYIGSEPPNRIEYRQEARSGAGCEGGGSCYRSGVVHSIFPVHVHELVHALTDHVGDPPFFFEEGLADVIGCQGFGGWHWTIVKEDADVRSLFQSDRFVEAREANLFETYEIAASFTRMLIDRGDDRFWRLYESLDFSASSEEVSSKIEEIYEVDLSSLIDAWTKRLESSDERCLNLTLCEFDSSPLSDEFVPGSECAPVAFEKRRTFEMTEEEFSFETELPPEGRASASIENCQGGSIGPGLMNLGTPSVIDDSERANTLWHVRSRPDRYVFASFFGEQGYSTRVVGTEEYELNGANRAVLLGRFLDGTVTRTFRAGISGKLYTTQVTNSESPSMTVRACIGAICESQVLENRDRKELLDVEEGDEITVRVSASTFNGSVGAVVAIRPD